MREQDRGGRGKGEIEVPRRDLEVYDVLQDLPVSKKAAPVRVTALEARSTFPAGEKRASRRGASSPMLEKKDVVAGSRGKRQSGRERREKITSQN